LPLGESFDAAGAVAVAVPSLWQDEGELSRVLLSLGELHVRGCQLDWDALFQPWSPRRVDLPTYAFQRRRFWLDSPRIGRAEAGEVAASAPLDVAAVSGADDDVFNARPEPTPPRTPIERLVCGIWAEVLGIAPGVHDNFFEHGGQSLMATQIASRVRKVFDVELPLADMLAHPTVAHTASRIESLLCDRVEGLTEHEAEHLLRQLSLEDTGSEQTA
jgi:acyl carrier protein